jgi:N-hydroxyarylamine O-acetyltransferase
VQRAIRPPSGAGRGAQPPDSVPSVATTASALTDVGSYLGRIGLDDAPPPTVEGLRIVHRAHVMAVPFENFDSANGTPVSLDPDHLETKLVARRRGGYCFEQNLVFAAALRSLGIDDVVPILARVRLGNDDHERPRTHLLLRVTIDGMAWHCDVGFGGDSLPEPIGFGPGPEVDLGGWRYRVTTDGDDLVLQMHERGGWSDQYGFRPEPAPMIDIETSNWFVSTFPRSPFVTGLRIAKQEPGQRRGLNVEEGTATFSEKNVAGESSGAVTLADAVELLASRFALPGARVDGDGIVLDT